MTIRPDASVVVIVRSSKAARGTFAQADESALIVRTGGWQVALTIARADVQKIRTGPTAKRRALGLLGGFGGFGGSVGGMLAGSLVEVSGAGDNLGGRGWSMGRSSATAQSSEPRAI